MGKLLIVSTDAGVIQAMTEQFPAGDMFQVETAASGVEAGAKVELAWPDVVLIDIRKDEEMLFAAIIRLHGVATVIALADIDRPALEALAAAGFTHVFYRPFNPAAVAGLVCARIGRRST